MNTIIHPNRWFIWTIVSIIVYGALIMWFVELYSIQQEIAVTENSAPITVSNRSSNKNHYDISKWKTYRNEEYGFEFNLPPWWAGNLSAETESLMLFNDFQFKYEHGGFLPYGGMELSVKALPSSGFGDHDLIKSTISRDERIIFGENDFKKVSAEYAKCHQQILYSILMPNGVLSFLFEYNPCETDKVNFETIADTIMGSVVFYESPDISNRKTYRNEEYGFEVEYPANWTRIDPREISRMPIYFSDQDTGDLLRITLRTYARTKSFDEGVVAYFESHTYPFDSLERIEVNGMPAYTHQHTYADTEEDAVTYYIQTKLGKYIEISGGGPVAMDLVDSIVENIKFIEPIDTSVWKTYHNNALRFEFKYPGWWTVDESNKPITFFDENQEKIVSMSFTNLALIGISYCSSYPEDERCEFIDAGSRIEVDWGAPNEERVIAETAISSSTMLSINLHKISDDTKQIFRQLLSTFKFIE